MLLSIIIPTYNRPKKIENCLKSILKNNCKKFKIELIIVDQSKRNKTKNIIKNKFPSVNYYKIKKKGSSRARNFGIKKSKGKILAFTDDDCIVAKNWINNIYNAFLKNEKIAGLFGKVLPYKPSLYKDKYCPSLFLRNNDYSINHSNFLQYDCLGFGSNMAFRKNIFNKHGVLKNWLGINAVGKSSEEVEFTYRLLRNGETLFYTPKILVFHDRWMKKKNYIKHNNTYEIGFFACYGYYALKGDKIAQKQILNYYKKKKKELNKDFKSLIYFLKIIIYCWIRGLLIGAFFSLKERKNFKNNNLLV